MKKEYTLIKIESESSINLNEIVNYLVEKKVGRIEVISSSRLEKIRELHWKEPNIIGQGIKILL